MIRPLGPTDVVALSGLHQQAALFEVTAHTWPRVQPESDYLSYLALLTHVLSRPIDHRGTWVHEERGAIVGIVFGQSRARGLVWDVERLYAKQDRDACALLDHFCSQAVVAGARRVFMETPSGVRGAEIGRRTSFERYSSAQLYHLPAGAPRADGPVLEARARARHDSQGLFQLYLAAVPRRTRSAEATTLEEWLALARKRERWPRVLSRRRQELVWSGPGGVNAWAEAVVGRGSQYLELLVHPDREADLDAILCYALQRTSPRRPVYARARDFQPALASALERAGFRPVCDVDIYVKQLAARARLPALLPAQVVRA